MTVDDQFAEWWVERKGFAPIPYGHVLPVNHALLQGHPEAPRLWEKFVNYVLVEKLGFTATTHERCLYFKRVNDELILFLRQVDDFAIAPGTKPFVSTPSSTSGTTLSSLFTNSASFANSTV